MTKTRQREHKERKHERSEFGKCLQDLMLSRNIVTATELAQKMRELGKDVTDRLIRQYWSGASKPSKSFMQDLGEVLNLTYAEKARLSMSVFYDDEWRAA